MFKRGKIQVKLGKWMNLKIHQPKALTLNNALSNLGLLVFLYTSNNIVDIVDII